MQAQAYERQTDFAERDGDETDHSALNAELDSASQSINALRDNLAKIQRDDGGLRPGIVDAEALADDAFDKVLGRVDEVVNLAQGAADSAVNSAVTAVNAAAAAASAIATVQAAENATRLNAQSALNSATSASVSQGAASASEAAARDAADRAKASENNAASSAGQALSSAQTAAAQASSANTSAGSAAQSATTATTKAGQASNSATAAAGSAAAAAASASAASLFEPSNYVRRDGQYAMTAPLQLSGDALAAKHAVPLSQVQQMIDQAVAAVRAVPAGTVVGALRSGVPAGWLPLIGGSIGSAASGATTRANADTLPLFREIWAATTNAVAPIQDAAGVATVRGASADADFAAGKRLPLPNIQDGDALVAAVGAGVGGITIGEVIAHAHVFWASESGPDDGAPDVERVGGYRQRGYSTSTTGGAKNKAAGLVVKFMVAM